MKHIHDKLGSLSTAIFFRHRSTFDFVWNLLCTHIESIPLAQHTARTTESLKYNFRGNTKQNNITVGVSKFIGHMYSNEHQKAFIDNTYRRTLMGAAKHQNITYIYY